jgi:hypothetical protein
MRVLSLVALSLLSCGSDFKPASQVLGVRLLATQASAPIAKPGETVTFKALAIDARAAKREPMRVFYLPSLCVNPKNDDQAQCYPSLGAGLPQGDLTGKLREGETTEYVVPQGADRADAEAYGIAFAFVIACAGHVEFVGNNAAYPTAPPFACVDMQGQRVNTDDFVFGYARIYIQDQLRNSNPILQALSVGGTRVDVNAGFDLARCTETEDALCPETKVDLQVPDESQEIDILASTPTRLVREEITASYFVTGGRMKFETTIVYDARSGKTEDSSNAIVAPKLAGVYALHAVVRDNRGGVSWQTIPFRVGP